MEAMLPEPNKGDEADVEDRGGQIVLQVIHPSRDRETLVQERNFVDQECPDA